MAGIGGVWRASIIWTFSGVAAPQVNVLHYRQLTDTVAATNPEDLANGVFNQVVTSMADCISDAISCDLIQIRGISDPTAGGDFAFSPATAGTLTGQTYAPQCSSLISWKTGLIGRHYQGRTYFPPPVEGSVDGAGQIGSTLLASLNTAANDMMTIPETGVNAGYNLVIYSAPGPGGSGWLGAITSVNSYAVRAHVKTQRRRGL